MSRNRCELLNCTKSSLIHDPISGKLTQRQTRWAPCVPSQKNLTLFDLTNLPIWRQTAALNWFNSTDFNPTISINFHQFPSVSINFTSYWWFGVELFIFDGWFSSGCLLKVFTGDGFPSLCWLSQRERLFISCHGKRNHFWGETGAACLRSTFEARAIQLETLEFHFFFFGFIVDIHQMKENQRHQSRKQTFRYTPWFSFFLSVFPSSFHFLCHFHRKCRKNSHSRM